MQTINTGFTSERFIGPNTKNNGDVWVVRIGDWETLVSYGKKVIHRNLKTDEIYLDQKFWRISFTTGVQRESYLGNPTPIQWQRDVKKAVVNDELTRQRIAEGRYKLANLN